MNWIALINSIFLRILTLDWWCLNSARVLRLGTYKLFLKVICQRIVGPTALTLWAAVSCTNNYVDSSCRWPLPSHPPPPPPQPSTPLVSPPLPPVPLRSQHQSEVVVFTGSNFARRACSKTLFGDKKNCKKERKNYLKTTKNENFRRVRNVIRDGDSTSRRTSPLSFVVRQCCQTVGTWLHFHFEIVWESN